jgi:hypothetical protein
MVTIYSKSHHLDSYFNVTIQTFVNLTAAALSVNAESLPSALSFAKAEEHSTEHCNRPMSQTYYYFHNIPATRTPPPAATPSLAALAPRLDSTF